MRIKRESPSLDDGNSSMHSGGDGMRTVKQELTPSVDSPLGHLDPSKITNMVVDQVGLGGGPGSSHDGFVVPGPPHQWPRASPSASPSIQQSPCKGMDSCGQLQQPAGTPTHMHNQQQIHMQQNAIGSPSVGNPVTPQQQHMQQQQGIMHPHTPTGHFDPTFQQQMQQGGYAQGGIPPSPGGMHIQMQQQALMSGGGNTNVQAEASPGMYNRQVMAQQQQQQQQQQMMVNQQSTGMGPMMGAAATQYAYPPHSQQQQWAHQQQQQIQQAAHYVRQPQMMGGAPGQRVMIQRVPYPPGYPGGMQAQSAQSTGQFAGRPGGPPMQRPAYPPGNAPPQYPYAPGQPGYQQQAAYQQHQQQMYQRQQVGQQMRPYMSPQGAMVTPTHQGVYANAAGPQPQTPQTPQPPFTPNGSRFPQPTPSPHYAADMRSPPLMSPTQAPLPPQATMPRPMSNGDLVAQPMRMTVQPQPVLPSLFCTYEPNFLPNVHPDICLAGCVFHMFEAERSITDKMDLPNIVLAIRMHGGEIEFGVKLYAERAAIITHVIVESIRTPHAHMALKDRKRLVTLQWLWDVLMKKQMDVPWRHAHLPSVFMDGCRPLFGRLISFSGFDEGERAAMKFMLEAMGARMTPYLSRHNNVLIAKTAGVEKVEKAREWDIQVVNYQWLADHYTGHQRIDNDSQRYQMGQPCDGVGPGPYVLEMVNDQFKQLLAAWKYPVIVASELWRRALETKQTVENDDAMFPNKKLKIQTAPPSDEDIDAREKRRIESGYQVSVIVAFVGIDDDVKEILTKKLRFLGGRVCEDVADCTHLVAPNGRRTERLLEAISLGKNIVNPYWIVHGYECRQWMDTLDYFLHDEDQEKHLGYNCKRSVLRARHRPVFEDVTFYLTPSVEPSRAMLSRLIKLAGGRVDEERPAPANIARCIETDAPYVVISCECDLKMVQYLLECNFPVYNADFVLISLLRQEMEPHPFYRVNVASIVRPAHHPHPGFRGMPRPIHEQAQPHRVKA